MRYHSWRNTLLLAAAAFALATAAASCGSDEPGGASVPGDACYDFVTYYGSAVEGSKFTMQTGPDSPMITYTSPYLLHRDSTLGDGDRMIILYKRADDALPYTDGPIDLYGYRQLDNKPQVIVHSDTAWASEPIKVTSMARTGHYINAQLQLSGATAHTPFTLMMQADYICLASKKPVFFITYHPVQPGENYFTGYASFDIAKSWSLPSVEAVEIRYMSPEGMKSEIFHKQSQDSEQQ